MNCFFKVYLLAFIFCSNAAGAQYFNEDSLRADVTFLASDNMKGRGNYSPELFQCAQYISGRFAKAGLGFFPGSFNYFHPFGHSPKGNNDSAINSGNTLFNLIGVIEGHSKPQEAIIFSAHYDHIGEAEQIFNGANDNAAGIAVLLALADYYLSVKTNERTIIFCAFSGEELGLIGSTEFAQMINPASVVAMVNMDMIGVPLFGKRKFFITGASFSNLEKILKKNLAGEDIKIIKEDKSGDLFSRSDNYPFATLGIPAHTIMTADDGYGCYHKPCDDTRYIDFKNLALLSRAIVIGMSTIVNAVEKPSRFKKQFN